MRQVREEGCKRFQELQQEIRTELESIVDTRDTSKGLETLQKSLALSNTYTTLCEQIKTAENSNALDLLVKEANIELDIYAQRSKHLNKMIGQRRELISVAGDDLDDLISDIKTPLTSQPTPDF